MNQQLSFVEKLNIQLSQGILPDELNYKEKDIEPVLDISKLQYQAFYRTFEYASNKFPIGWEGLAGFDRVIESCIPQKTPLEEILERQKEPVEELDFYRDE